MSDYYPVDADKVRKSGMKGVVATGAGVGILLVNSLLHIPVLGWIISGALVLGGVIGFLGRNKTDKATGSVLLGAGALGIASIFFKGITSFLFGASGVGLIGYGIFNIFKFVKGLKSRS